VTLALFAILCHSLDIEIQNRPLRTERIMDVRAYFSAVALSVIASGLSSTQVLSGPDDTTKQLMNDSVSLLDWGILQITYFRLNGENGNPVGYASYDYDDDRIYIRSYTTNDAEIDSEKVKAICGNWIDAVRVSAWVSPTEGKPLVKDYSYFASLFRHDGFVRGELADETKRLQELDKKFHIEYFIRKSDYSERYRCTAPLLSIGFATQSFE
jgi:hypothetical protein